MFVPMDPPDAAFMLSESRNTPMHVGGLQLFRPPDGAGPDYARQVYEGFLASEDLAPLFLKRPFRSVRTAGQWFWTDDTQFDLEHHIRHNALPRPGRIRELLDLCGRLHGTRMSLERPLWEAHLIEGLDDGRIAMYTKIHHSLVDGVAAMRLLQSSLSTDPADNDMPSPWVRKAPTTRIEKEHAAGSARFLELPIGAARSALAVSVEAAGLPRALVRTLNRGLRKESAPISFAAPRTILNQNITGARRFAAQDWPIERIKRIGKSTRTSINDVVLAMCSGALHAYLLELDALPGQPLVAMVPVSLKLNEAGSASQAGGNAVGALMATLATDLADPGERLQAIHASIQGGKAAMAEMSQVQLLAMSALGMSPAVVLPMLGLQGMGRPPFNLIISNVPGPKKPLYLNGAALDGMYPLSIPLHGQALNITCTSYVDRMAVGLTGCRRTVPHLQRLLTHLDTELSALELAAGLA